MKCQKCVDEHLKNIVIDSRQTALKAVFEALDHAKLAVTVRDGKSLCEDHIVALLWRG